MVGWGRGMGGAGRWVGASVMLFPHRWDQCEMSAASLFSTLHAHAHAVQVSR